MEERAKILIVEDESSMRDILRMLLESEGYEVASAGTGPEGAEFLQRDIYDLVITDIKMPGMDGFGILKKAQEVSPESLVIMITAFGTTEAAIEAMKKGAYDYINKPFKIDEIRLIVKNALDKRRLKAEVSILRQKVRSVYVLENIAGKSRAIEELIALIPRVAQSHAGVLITGESGTGKDLVANAIHNLSPRAGRNFVAINCASLPEGLLESELFGHMKGSFTGATVNKQGLFETADGGTLFLDEIGEMPPSLQSKLLRALENGSIRRVGGNSDIKVDVRVISATNRNLSEAVKTGAFREDLFYRLNVVPIHIPPLRERPEDIPVYVERFLLKHSKGRKLQFTASALNTLMQQGWPGNVRELENLIERTILFVDKDIITEHDLAPGPGAKTGERIKDIPEIGSGIELEPILEGIERGYLLSALERTHGQKTEAAKLLGLTFRSFRHRLAKYGLNKDN